MNKIEKFYFNLEKQAIEEGFESIEMFYQKNKEFTTKIFRSEIEKYQIAEESGISIRGMFDEKIGYYYSENIDETIIPDALQMMKESSKLIEIKDETILDDVQVIKDDSDYFKFSDHSGLVEKMMGAEEDLKSKFEKIVDVPYNLYSDIESETTIMNSYGLNLNQKMSLYYYVISALAKNTERSKTSLQILTGRESAWNLEVAVNQIGMEATALLDAEPVESGTYELILKNNVAGEILNAFSGIFSGEMVVKGISVLKDRLNEQIGSKALTIVDDPSSENALIHRAFDDEGTKTDYKAIIDQGKLLRFLQNSKTAKKLGMDRTGNAYRSSIQSQLGISHTNMYIKPGDYKFEDLVSEVKKGIIVTDVQALHSGLNPISGDFSLPVQGYLVEGGLVKGTVDQITISGNVIDLFQSLEKVADDLKFYLPNGMGSVGSPSLYINKINVAGK